ncbi:hypothetical protein CASFOL_040016 [Castilleja foliolosa]|uniref:Uncharacterized protein n=1 Tax=Castilleja foliolosa TaxID=1961234 RepID=A0ABD3BGC1_9LAMI
MELPPGFRFHPTDEELITHYLSKKVFDDDFTSVAIGEADMNKIEPFDLPSKLGEKEWYFFSMRDKKYPTRMRTNRATVSGYWKATGKDKEIYRELTVALSKIACNRLQKELMEWQMNPPTGFKHKATDNLQRWVIEVNGAPGTPYAGEMYQLQVDFPEHYPMEAPQVIFIPPAPMHPHIYSNGHICLDS